MNPCTRCVKHTADKARLFHDTSLEYGRRRREKEALTAHLRMPYDCLGEAAETLVCTTSPWRAKPSRDLTARKQSQFTWARPLKLW